MKRIIAGVVCLLLTASLLGCTGESEYVPSGGGLATEPDATGGATQPSVGAEQTLCLAYYPTQPLNPLKCPDYTNRTVLGLVYQGLFATDRGYDVWPVLCGSYAISEDMCTHVFSVAENATFSDGAHVTAADVIASLNAAKEGEIYGSRFFHIASMEATADNKVKIVTSIAMENLPILLDIPILKAAQVAAERPLGTGPYVLESTAGGLRLRRRTDWWCRSTNLMATASAISLVPAQDNSQIRDEFEFADVGLVCADPGSDSYADYRCDYELWDCESGMMLYLACNRESDLFSNEKLCAALTYAIDRKALAEEFYRGFAWPATLPASPQSPCYSSGLARKYAYDPEKFAKAIADAGATGMSVTLLVNADDSLRLRVTRRIADMLEAGGLFVELKQCDSDSFQNELFKREYDLYIAQTKLSPNMDLTQFFYIWGSLSYGAMDDAGTYSLCMEALANQGNYYNLHKKIMDEGRLCPILFKSYGVYATRGLLTDLEPSRDNVFFYTIGEQTVQDIQVPLEN